MSSTIIIDRVQITGLDGAKVKEADWEDIVLCPLCGKLEGAIGVINVAAGPSLVGCTLCEFGFLARRPTEAWVDTFYQKQWDKARASEPPPEVPPNPKAFELCHRYFSGQGNKVLDIGAGYGGMLLPFKEKGWDCYAVEPSKHRAKVLETQGVTVVSNGEPLEGECKLVIMHHSLEHRYDPRKALQEAKVCLAPGGHLYVVVPDMFQEYPLQAAHYVPHLSLFTSYSLVNLLEQEGFAVVAGRQHREIEMIATSLPLGKSHEHAIQAADDFEAAVDIWVHSSTGMAAGARTLIWSTANTQDFRYADWRMKGHLKHPESVVPRGMHGMLRALWVRGDMHPGLPINVEHSKKNNQTVWIK